MKIVKLISLLIIVLTIVFYSCEKEITIDLPQAEEKIVVEGWIDQNDYPIVFLTKNLPYFGTVDSAMLFNIIIQDATVIVTDGVTIDTLKLIPLPDFNYFPPIYYKGSKIKGEINKTYFLTVKAQGKTLTSKTTIPPPVYPDSVWFKVEPQQDNLGYLWGRFTDPPELGNYYRLFTKRLGKDKRYIPVLGSIYDDKFFNGQSFQFSMMRGVVSTTDQTVDPEFGFFKIGDTIGVKICTIDKAHYDFWRTAEGEMYSGGNPFATPTQIVTNIEGEGLGVWGGYGVYCDMVIAK
ncbi:MAG: DUF4249 domain-containing protein [Bacteroidales bacterium]